MFTIDYFNKTLMRYKKNLSIELNSILLILCLQLIVIPFIKYLSLST